MASANITIRAVEALAAGATIWDTGHREAVRGFGVRRQRDQATYVLKYRVFGRQRFLTIGPHGSPWTPNKARREAKRLLGLVADGKDPADAKALAALQAADTLRKIADEYLKHAKAKQRPRPYSETERYLLVVWKPLHPVSVFKITRRHVAARVADIAKDQGAVTAARARTALSTMFNWAIREGLDIPANPVLGSNRPVQPKSRDRVLTDAEIGAIWRACTDDDYGRIVRILIVTAQRRDEIGGMLWPELANISSPSPQPPWPCSRLGAMTAISYSATARAGRAIGSAGSRVGRSRRPHLMRGSPRRWASRWHLGPFTTFAVPPPPQWPIGLACCLTLSKRS